LKNRPDFLLSKWYLDCVSDTGDVLIGYVAQLRWRSLIIHSSSLLLQPNGEPTEVKTSLHKISVPAISERSIYWKAPRLGLEGNWQATAAPLRQTLLGSELGCIEWHCLQPSSRAAIRLGQAPCIEGLGYVEHILISIPPWRLPIDELRWGRFLSETDALVWIDWRGSHPLTLVFHNGFQYEDLQVTDWGITGDSNRPTLTFSERQILREGQLIKTALSVVPGINKLLPLAGLQTCECKWRSRGVLSDQETVRGSGWAIHEVVRFS
jgi:hypothetical protein